MMNLNQVRVAAFSDELAKIAATVDELQAGVHRKLQSGSIRRIPAPSLKQFMRFSEEATDLPSARKALGGWKAKGLGLSSAMGASTIARPRQLSELGAAQAAAGAPSEVVDMGKNLFAPIAKKYGGTAVIPKGVGGTTGQFKRMGAAQLTTGKGRGAARRALNVVSALHEGSEQRVKARELAPGAGHLNPMKVLGEERNLTLKMSGPGAKQARRIMGALRRQTGEAAKFQHLVRQRFGSRAAKLYGRYGKGQKMPKAMRKRLTMSLASGRLKW